MTNITVDMVDAALAAAHPHIWSAPGFLHPSGRSGTSTAQADALREKMVRALEAAQAAAPASERLPAAADLAIELGQLAGKVARLAPTQPVSPPVLPHPLPDAQLIIDFYQEVSRGKSLPAITGEDIGALTARVVAVRDEIVRLRGAELSTLADAARREGVLQSRISLLQEEVSTLNRKLTAARMTKSSTETPVTPPPPNVDPVDDIVEKIFGFAERGLDFINTKLGEKKDDK
jgi:uncharacterized small protein (DUF1192 family)